MGLELRGQAGLLELLEQADEVVGVQLEGLPWRREGGGRARQAGIQVRVEGGTLRCPPLKQVPWSDSHYHWSV